MAGRAGGHSVARMTTRPPHWPGDHAAFTHSRRRWLDGLTADHLLREVARGTVHPGTADREHAMNAIQTEGDLCILTATRRLILGCFTQHQRDLADVVRSAAGVPESFGVVHLGPVRIVVEPLLEVERPDG